MEDWLIGNIIVVKDRFVRDTEAESYGLSQIESRDLGMKPAKKLYAEFDEEICWFSVDIQRGVSKALYLG